MPTLFDAYTLGDRFTLKNRIVMAPMTRTRTSVGDLPNELMAKYYGQRASAGLIVTEATDVSPHTKGYAWTPGIYTGAQVEGWRRVTDAVHRHGGRIFMQLWHVGRMAHISLLPNGEAPWGVTDEQAIGSQIFAHNAEGNLTYAQASPPRQIRTEEIPGLVNEFALAARNAKLAGFDGVEIHAANGYLLEQFMSSTLNRRTDGYSGRTVDTRSRLVLEVIDAAIREMGAGRIGIRLSPRGKYNSMPNDPQGDETFFYLCNELNRREVAYLHLLYQLLPSGNMETAQFKETHLPDEFLRKVRQTFRRGLIWCGGFTKESAQAALDTGSVDLIAFGRPFIANPDLVDRFKNGWPLAEADRSFFYTRSGEKGYTDFSPYVPAVSSAA